MKYLISIILCILFSTFAFTARNPGAASAAGVPIQPPGSEEHQEPFVFGNFTPQCKSCEQETNACHCDAYPTTRRKTGKHMGLSLGALVAEENPLYPLWQNLYASCSTQRRSFPFSGSLVFTVRNPTQIDFTDLFRREEIGNLTKNILTITQLPTTQQMLLALEQAYYAGNAPYYVFELNSPILQKYGIHEIEQAWGIMLSPKDRPEKDRGRIVLLLLPHDLLAKKESKRSGEYTFNHLTAQQLNEEMEFWTKHVEPPYSLTAAQWHQHSPMAVLLEQRALGIRTVEITDLGFRDISTACRGRAALSTTPKKLLKRVLEYSFQEGVPHSGAVSENP